MSRTGRETVIRELVSVDEPSRRLGIEHASGLPVHSYAGSITLRPHRDSTDVEWRADIEPLYWPAVGVIDVLRSVSEKSVNGLAASAEARWRRSTAVAAHELSALDE